MVKASSTNPTSGKYQTHEEEVEEPTLTFESLFIAYSNFGPHSDEQNVNGILLSQLDLWFNQAKLIGETISMTDTGLLFNYFRKRRITFQEFEIFLENLCEIKDLSKTDIKEHLFNAGMPTLAPKI